MSKEIKISKAKEIANECEYDMVIIIGINDNSSGHITTYGKNKGFCKIAGHIGQKELAPKIFSDNGILANLDFDEIK